MFLAKVVNKLLAPFNVAITRRGSLDTLNIFSNSLNTALTSCNTPVTKAEIIELRNELLRHQISLKWNLIDTLGKNASISPRRLRRCPLCEHEEFEESFLLYRSQCLFGGGDLVRFQCPACDLIFGPDKIFRMMDSELAQEYEWHYRIYSENDSTDHEIRSFKSLNPSKSGVYLNYGAGAWSKTMQILKHDGWNVYAYEPHDSAHSGESKVISNRAQLSTMKFDGLFSNNLLEHLRNPVDELIFMKSLLKPNAMMSHATPCFAYLYEYTRFHLFFYVGRSRDILAHKSGLNLADFVEDGEFMNVIFKQSNSKVIGE